MTPHLVRTLVTELPTGTVVTDSDILASLARDQSAMAVSGTPTAAVIARSVHDVRATLAFAEVRGVPVVTRGAGSGLAGGANATDGCIMLSTAAMTCITDVSTSGLYATVEPGVINAALKARVNELGLHYPPDPASADFSTLGGNVATNAGGLCCVKYGVTGDYVLSLDVVLAGGALVRTGATTRKNVAGYDLTSLIVGSEGTLGVIVGATLRLVPRPGAAGTMVAIFPDLAAVGAVPGELAEAGITPSMLEVMDRSTIVAVEHHYRMGLDTQAGALLIAQADSPDADNAVRRMARIATAAGADDVHHTADPTESAMLLQARKLAYPALERSGRKPLLDDVAVPVNRVAEFIACVEAIGLSRGVPIATFGHLGDGNLHPTLLGDRNASAAPGDSELAAFHDIVEAAIGLGGVATGEHGVGTIKTSHLARQLDDEVIRIQRSIKSAFDPRDILNPGKALAADTGVAPVNRRTS